MIAGVRNDRRDGRSMGGAVMPIRLSERARYPADWRAISLAVREAAEWTCQGAPGIYDDCRSVHGHPHPVTGSRVVLTVAHLNHQPEDCSPGNLRALCQRCHLAYDAGHHQATARASRRARLAVGDLL